MLWLKCFCIVDEIVTFNNLHACVTTMSMTDILKREARENMNIGSLESFQNSKKNLNWGKKKALFLVCYARTKIWKLLKQWHGKYDKVLCESEDEALILLCFSIGSERQKIWLPKSKCKSPWSQDSAWWVYKRLFILKFPIWILWNAIVSSYKWPSTMIKGFSF